MYRLLLIIGLLLWLGLTLLLNAFAPPEVLPLFTLRFSSAFSLAWLLSGAGIGLLALRAALPRRSAGDEWVARFEGLAAYLNEGVVVCSGRGRVRWHNDAARELLLEGDTLVSNAGELLKRAQSSGKVAIQTLPLREGLRFSVQALPLDRQNFAVICRPMQSASGQGAFYENFIRRIVHDMRNPLAAIIGHAANMRQSPTVEPDGWRKSAGTIEDEAQRLARLVDSLLFDARLAYVPLELQRLDVADVLEEALYAHDEQAQNQGKSLQLETPPGAMPLEGDRDLLVRAFENLIDNSLKYSGEQGKLLVRLSDLPNMVVIQFSDNGEGIPPEYLPDRIFEPLVRARSHGSGSGLGLSIVRKIIEMHGGTISAQSKLGEGTTMTVRLPKPSERVMSNGG